jgi:hypothetical protein
MSGLTGMVTGTNEQVSTKDQPDRDQLIIDLKLIKGWDLRSNIEEYKIDLQHNDRRGGCDVENAHYKFSIKNITSISYNQFTLPVPTANFPWRKEHFFINDYFEWTSNKGKKQWANPGDQPDFEFNSIFRYTKDGYNEGFFVDYEIYKNKIYKTGLPNTAPWGDAADRGRWAPGKIFTPDQFGNKVPEYWMCWELKDVEIWVKENGIWERDTTFDDPKVYKDFVDNYRILYERNKNILDKVRNKKIY